MPLAICPKQLSNGIDENGFLAAAEYKPTDAWTIFARAESVQSTEIFAGAGLRTVGELTLGGIHDWTMAEHFKLGVGGLYTFAFVPGPPAPSSGRDPHGAMVSLRPISQQSFFFSPETAACAVARSPAAAPS